MLARTATSPSPMHAAGRVHQFFHENDFDGFGSTPGSSPRGCGRRRHEVRDIVMKDFDHFSIFQYTCRESGRDLVLALQAQVRSTHLAELLQARRMGGSRHRRRNRSGRSWNWCTYAADERFIAAFP
jgi:hypothetical protein